MQFRIRFFGMVCHVLDGEPVRAVFLKEPSGEDPNHKARMIIDEDLVDPQSVQQIFPGTTPTGGKYTLPLTHRGLAFAGATTTKPQAAGSFSDLVPSLVQITETMMSEINAGVYASDTTAWDVIQAWFDYPGGSLTATPYPQQGKVVWDHHPGRPSYLRPVGKEVYLQCENDEAVLLVTDGSTDPAKRLILTPRGQRLDFSLENGSTYGSGHWKLNYSLSVKPVPDDPDLLPESDGPTLQSDVPGCSNSQFP
ncbi:MAG: hypothetical protein WBX15_06665 [Thermoanaerobaculia bacterium]